MSEKKRPWAADGDDFVNWFAWLRSQSGGETVLKRIRENDMAALYSIMCRLADEEASCQ